MVSESYLMKSGIIQVNLAHFPVEEWAFIPVVHDTSLVFMKFAMQTFFINCYRINKFVHVYIKSFNVF